MRSGVRPISRNDGLRVGCRMRIDRRRPDAGSGSPLRRLVASVLATLLLAGTLDAGRVHPCPHHDVLPAQGTPRGVHHDAQHGGPDDGTDTAGDPGDAHAGACVCIGDCLAGGGSSFAPTAVMRPGVAPAVETTSHPSESGHAAPGRRVAYLLPYSTAPPSQH